jgi:hypothetical protein
MRRTIRPVLVAFGVPFGVLGGVFGLVACAPPSLPITPGPGGGAVGCSVFPGDNIWNTRVDKLPVSLSSAAYINAMGTSASMHADFGSGQWNGGPIGIPYAVVRAGQPKVNVQFGVRSESDPGPYPIPANVPIEGGAASGGDRHVIVVDADACRLYELFSAFPNGDGSWRAYSGAVFDLRSDALRPDGWTSADAAGLPILAGLVRYDEVASGQIRHALRITAPITRSAHVWPARHDASAYTDPAIPPMGQRFRLKASFNISGFSPMVRVILQAMKTYGVVLADNGASWFVSGAPDPRWNNDILHQLRWVPGSAFEAVDATALRIVATSAQARQP